MHPLIGLLACAAPLIPGEVVLGVDVPATTTLGTEAARLGASVAWFDGSWLASAPGDERLWRDGNVTDEPAAWVGWWSGETVGVSGAGEVRVDGELRWTVPGATSWAFGPTGILAAGGGRLHRVDRERSFEVPGVAAVAWGTERVLAVVCDPACEARAWDLDDAPLGAVVSAGEGGAVGEWDGVAWAGDPQWDDDDGPGEVCAEDGGCVAGLPGDHLGGAIGGGYAVGTFNKWVVPARARVVPLAGGTVLAMERGAEVQPLALDGDGETLIVGAPYHPAHGVPSGAVVEVALAEVP